MFKSQVYDISQRSILNTRLTPKKYVQKHGRKTLQIYAQEVPKQLQLSEREYIDLRSKVDGLISRDRKDLDLKKIENAEFSDASDQDDENYEPVNPLQSKEYINKSKPKENKIGGAFDLKGSFFQEQDPFAKQSFKPEIEPKGLNPGLEADPIMEQSTDDPYVVKLLKELDLFRFIFVFTFGSIILGAFVTLYIVIKVGAVHFNEA